ncbi:aminotransferase class I/II-fold pyridoxal phosphate-dependent enzyme [Vibrio sinaloensis]|nr:aminotransferase class I/II-fold pyridoxal phosphate-dependent enzyme [Vibrio sinaloensis]
MKRQLGDAKIWISNPTWANHNGVFTAAGIETAQYSYYNAETKDKDFAAMVADLEKKRQKVTSYFFTAAVITQRVSTLPLKNGKC